MNVLRSASDAPAAERAVAIGTFDGVHRGHRAVIEAARATGLRTCVVTFSPHPRTVLGYEVRLLTPVERRIELLGELEPDDLLVVDFTPELATKTPEEFVDSVLRPLGAKAVLAGEDFRFGAGRRGDLALLERLGFEIVPVPLVDGVSSSRIRELLAEGDIGGAAQLLGRPPELEGPVVPGDQRGGTLGFPTANLAVAPEILVPAYGIYAGAARLLDTGDAGGASHGPLDRRQSALRRRRTADRGVPPRLRGRSLRTPAARRAVGAAARRARRSKARASSWSRSPATSRPPVRRGVRKRRHKGL